MKIERFLHRMVVLWMVILSPFTFHLSPLSAQTSLLSVGVRGGGQTWLPTKAEKVTGDIQGNIGGSGLLDLRYTFYGDVSDKIGLGFAVGAGIGYGSTSLKGTCTDTLTNHDYNNYEMKYTNTGQFVKTDKFAKADISLLFAMRFGAVTVNIGPRFMLPFATTSSLTITSAVIDAYFPKFDNHVTNEVITGYLQTPYTQKDTSNLPQYNLLLAIEAGYEWTLQERHIIGLQAYANFGLNNYITPKSGPLISVAPIEQANTPAQVTVGSPEGLISRRRFIDFGIRVYYAFPVRATTGTSSTSSSRDTRKHHNRYQWY